MKDASVNERHPIYGPTHPKFFEELSPHMKFLAQSSTDRYQLGSVNKNYLNQINVETKCKNDKKT
jgi:hypothetical protein